MSCECGCGRPSAPGGRLSWACYKQRERKGTTTRKAPERGVRHPSSRDMVKEAIEAYNDADPMDDGAQERAWARLRTAWRRYFKRTANTVQTAPETKSRG